MRSWSVKSLVRSPAPPPSNNTLLISAGKFAENKINKTRELASKLQKDWEILSGAHLLSMVLEPREYSLQTLHLTQKITGPERKDFSNPGILGRIRKLKIWRITGM